MCNILPKKNWHVLKKENIDRVRRDEAKAAEEEQARLRKIAIAEKEARTELLRDRARAGRLSRDAVEAGTSSSSLPIAFTSAVEEALPRTHINFFKESESGNAEEKANQERKKEEKEEQEKWERKVGISMALGQTPGGPLDSQLNPWWMQAKKKDDGDDEEEEEEDDDQKKTKKEKKKGKYPEKKPLLSVKERFDEAKIKEEGRQKRDERRKRQMDPMMEVEKQLTKHKKHKKDKHHYGDRERSSIRKEKKEKKKKKTIEELRAERLKREGKERTKTLDFLGGKPSKKEKDARQEKERDADKNYYNSQFFPELARKKKQ